MIFNRSKVLNNRNNAASTGRNINLLRKAAEEIIDRLKIIDKEYIDILNINCGQGLLTQAPKNLYNPSEIIATDISLKMLTNFEHERKLQIDEENILLSLNNSVFEIKPNYFNLITHPLGLQNIGDVQNFLKQINLLLKDDGIFIGNFIGGESLKNLRFKLIELEDDLSLPHYPHIHPLIHFDHIAPLLQNSGFNEIIVDFENIELEFSSPLELMRAIKDAGESNALKNRINYSLSKKLYNKLTEGFEKFNDRLQLISFIASKNKNNIKLKPHNLDV